MLGRLLGFVREMLIASSFGATEITDSYLTALILFDIAMAANSSFIQGTFAYSTGIKSQSGFEKGLLRAGLKIFLIILVCAVIFYPLAGYLIPLFYSRSAEANAVIINSSRLFFLLASLLAASGVFAALLQMRGRITNPGRLIIFLNVLSIAFLLLFKENAGIISIPLGFLAGGALFFAYQIILIKKDNRTVPEYYTPGEFKFSGWMAVSFLLYANALFPSILGLMERFFAYSFAGGTFSHYQYSQKILQLPLTILSFAISTSLLPFQIKSVNEGKEDEFAASTRKGIFVSVVTSVFFAVIFFTAAEPIIQILYKRGMFNSFDLQETALSLRILSIGLVPYLLTPVIANIYFSRSAVKNILLINGVFIVVQAVSLTLLSSQMPGIKALSVNWVILAWLNNILLVLYAHSKKYYTLPGSLLIKLFVLLVVSAVLSYAGYEYIPAFDNAFVPLITAGVIIAILYITAVMLLFGNELKTILKKRS